MPNELNEVRNMDYNALFARMRRNGFDFEQAILPRKNKSRHIDFAELKKKYESEGADDD